MEGQSEQSPKSDVPINNDDLKHVSGLSTILVASIQEAKDKISQIEYIFCKQLYPNFQLKFKDYQTICSVANRVAEEAWKKKEDDFKLPTKELELEKKMLIEANRYLLQEKETQMKKQGGMMRFFLEKLRCQKHKIEELEDDLFKKSKEVDEGTRLHMNLVELVHKKASAIDDADKVVKDKEERMNLLLIDLNGLRNKVEELQVELKEKAQEVADGKKISENLLKKIEVQAFELMQNEKQLTDCKNERMLLAANFESLKEKYDELDVVLKKKENKVEEGKKLHEQLLRQIESKGSEMLKNEQQFQEHEKKNELILAKVNDQEEKVNELQVKHRESGDHAFEERDSYEKLLRQIESKASELITEKKKRRDLLDAYKRLKSQYNFLCQKNGLTTENMTLSKKLEDEDDNARFQHNPKTFPNKSEEEDDTARLQHNPKHYLAADAENRISNTPTVAFDKRKMMDVIGLNADIEDEKGTKPIETSISHFPTSSFSSPKCPSSVRSNPISGTKRPASGWRDARSHQCQAGPDPHDDFLDTPLENIRGNQKKAMKEAVDHPVAEDMIIDGSDDETQDVSAEKMARCQVADKGSFKYVEPVRKKADREKLKGFECNQCKKFYDAVLDDGKHENEDGCRNFRCEHHDGVSRHRYKYVPPSTPEGFWNIGFESEM